MLGLILDSYVYDGLADIKIGVPSLNETATFKLADLFLFLVILSNSFYRESLDEDQTTIRVPSDMSTGSEPGVNENMYDWKKKYFPEIFVQKNGRVHGFNTTLDKDALIEILERRHSHLRFGSPDEEGEDALTDEEYKERADKWLEELGVSDFVVPNNNINTISDLVSAYTLDTEVYNKVRTALIKADNDDDKKYLEYIYQELFTRPFDTGFYTVVKSGEVITYKDLMQVLKNRDYLLYDVFISVMTESNIEAKQDLMRSIMNDTVETLKYYLSGTGLEYLYSFVSIESFGMVIKYIYLMLNFFKSYKVYFLDPYYTLMSDDELENTMRASDVVNEYRITHYKWDKSLVDDTISGENLTKFMIDEGEYDKMFEMADVYAYYDPDPLFDLDIDGVTAEKGETVETTDIDGGEADPSEIAPYITLNAGHSYLGLVDMTDMNGGIADEEYKEYYVIDGGEAYDPDVMKTDAMGSQMFTYVIDGGAAGKTEFINNSMHLQLIGTELEADAVISEKDTNCIEVNDDGIFISAESFGSETAFQTMVETLNNIIGRVKTDGAITLLDIQILLNDELRYERIKEVLTPITADMEYVNDMMADDKFIKLMHKYVDTLVSNFNTKYNVEKYTNPYAWEEL